MEQIVLIGLATAALARLIVHERGPWGVLERARKWVKGNGVIVLRGFTTCAICAGFWIALGLYLLVVLVPAAASVLVPFAAMGLAYLALGMIGLYQGPPDDTSNP